MFVWWCVLILLPINKDTLSFFFYLFFFFFKVNFLLNKKYEDFIIFGRTLILIKMNIIRYFLLQNFTALKIEKKKNMLLFQNKDISYIYTILFLLIVLMLWSLGINDT